MIHQSFSLQIDTIFRVSFEDTIQKGVVKSLTTKKEALLFLKEEEKLIQRSTHTAKRK